MRITTTATTFVCCSFSRHFFICASFWYYFLHHKSLVWFVIAYEKTKHCKYCQRNQIVSKMCVCFWLFKQQREKVALSANTFAVVHVNVSLFCNLIYLLIGKIFKLFCFNIFYIVKSFIFFVFVWTQSCSNVLLIRKAKETL